MSGKILVENSENISTITLNRPEKLNALDPEMLNEFEMVLAALDADEQVRAVIVTGAGDRAFCVGADIHVWGALEPLAMWQHWVRNGHRIFDRLARLRQPVIAALNGYTFGGGLELALATDLRLATDYIELALPEVTLGTVPGWGGTQRLTALVGSGRAKQMIFSGDRISATTAERWGLVNEIVPAGELMARARALATRIAANAPISVAVAKQLIDSAAGTGHGQTLEALAGAMAAATEDGQEGLAAFRERRPSTFKGK